MRAKPTYFHFKHLMLSNGWTKDARVTCRGGVIEAIEYGVKVSPSDLALGVAIPGMPNLHSHAFQRGMAGLGERRGPGNDSFWSWRQIMYKFVERIGPDELHAIAALAYMEMLESGFTRVGEFHYLHHDHNGVAYTNPAEMSMAIAGAAQDSGIGLTYLPVFYAHSGFGGQEPMPSQQRFINDLESFARLIEQARPALTELPDMVMGIAPHSLRAVTPNELVNLVALVGDAPVHMHIAEQVKEVDDCLAWSGARPVEWLLANTDIDQRWCLVHATHLTDEETAGIASSGAVVGLCPVTEANLGDGIFPGRRFREHEGKFGIGSDSNILIDMTEELRLLEYGQRLSERRRAVMAEHAEPSTGQNLFGLSIIGGSQALGTPAGLAIGHPLDFITIDQDHPALMHFDTAHILDGLIFAAGKSGIDGVWRRGQQLVSKGRHRNREHILRHYAKSLRILLQ